MHQDQNINQKLCHVKCDILSCATRWRLWK